MDIIKNNSAFIIGMVHLLPLPDTANFSGDCKLIIEQALKDALSLEEGGVDGIMIENMGDNPFSVKLNNAQITALGAVSGIISQKVRVPLGIDAAFNDYKSSLSLANFIGANFVRIPVFVDTVEFYGGLIKPVAQKCMSYRNRIRANKIKVLADVHVKHSNMLIPNVKLEQSCVVAQQCGADAIIITGTHTGNETPLEMIKIAKGVVTVPVIAGSGVNTDNVVKQLSVADGAIVGSSLKDGGILTNPINLEKTKQLVAARNKGVRS